MTEFINIIMSILGYFNPENEKHLAVRISMFLNIAFVLLIGATVTKVEPYVVQCQQDRASIASLQALLKEEQQVAGARLERINKLEQLLDNHFK